MRFGIRRLDAGGDNGRRYHLFDEDGRVELVADYGSRWLAAEPDHHVRFARSSGDVVASMRLPRPLLPGHNRQRSVSYAVILNHAVYAIINAYNTSTKTKAALVTHFTIEVEGRQWLVLEQTQGDPYFCLYDEASADLAIYDELLAAPLPEPIGQIYQSAGEYDFMAEMEGQLPHASLVLLALIFLIDPLLDTGDKK